MKKIKSILSIILVLSLLLGTNYANATTNATTSETNGEIKLGTHYFHPNNGDLSEIQKISPKAVVYPVGTIKIEDMLNSSSAIFSADSKSETLSKLLTTTFDLIEGIPVVGTIYCTGKNILEWTMAFNSDISNVDYTQKSILQTSYSYRNFYHRIYGYTDTNSWKDVGYSLSRYYYKHTFVRVYSKTTGDYVSSTADFTHTNGYSPAYTKTAANYMKYSTLSTYGSECFQTGRYYTEQY